MNKKEIAEIKKQFSPANCAITRICGCYVDGEKTIKTKSKDAFLSLPEEEMFKYFDLFKKTLSGGIGKNLMDMEFPLEQETSGGTQEFLLRLRDSKLQDDSLLDEFYQKIIDFYNYGENYYIILIHANYDVPGKSSDGEEMFDASDEVYEFLLCSICPVKLSKAGLCYNSETNHIEDRIRDWIVEMPDIGFLFPAFNDRSTDIHSLLYYSKNAKEFQDDLIDNVLGCHVPMPARDQKSTFQYLVSDTLGDSCNFDTVKTLHENLTEMIEEHKDEPEPLRLDKTDVKKLLERSGAREENLEQFDREFDAAAGDTPSLLASNVANTRTFEVKTPDVVIKVNPDRTDLVETKLIDGIPYLVIQLSDSVEVNGIPVSNRPSGSISE